MDNIRTVKCGVRTISYVLTRKKVRNINLRVKPDGIVHISAPQRVPIKMIEGFITEKSDFIFRSLDKFAGRSAEPQFPAADGNFRSGDKLRLWGKDYTLEISSGKNYVAAGEKNIIVYTDNEKNIGNILVKFYNSQAEAAFTAMNRKTYLMFHAKGYDVPFAEIKIRRMTSRWGSCHYTDGRIVMNSRLTLFPDICAAYVFVHEYAHFIVPDHSADFYAVVSDIMPDYKICMRMLKY